MAISSYKTYLMYDTSTSGTASYKKLVDIKNYPDLGGTPESLDTTTLSDKMRTHIPGIQDTSQMEFECNYDKTTFSTITALADKKKKFQIIFGGTEGNEGAVTAGSDGVFEFEGYVTVYVTGGGVNEVVGMKVVITPSSVITLKS